MASVLKSKFANDRIKLGDISRSIFALTKEIFYVIVTMYRFVKAILVWDFEVLFYINFDKILLNKVKIISKRSICRAIDWVLKSLTFNDNVYCSHACTLKHRDTVQIQWLFEWFLIGWPCILLMNVNWMCLHYMLIAIKILTFSTTYL